MSSSMNKALSSIPIKVIGPGMKKGAGNYQWKRRAIQIIILVLLVIIPVSGLIPD